MLLVHNLMTAAGLLLLLTFPPRHLDVDSLTVLAGNVLALLVSHLQ